MLVKANVMMLKQEKRIPCDQRIRLTFIVEQYDVTPETLPNSLFISVKLRDELGGEVRLEYSQRLSSDLIYEHTEGNRSWTEIILPWVTFTEGTYVIDYEVFSSELDFDLNTFNNANHTTNTQQLIVERDHNGNLQAEYNDLYVNGILNDFILFPNPTATGMVTFFYSLNMTASARAKGSLEEDIFAEEKAVKDIFDGDNPSPILAVQGELIIQDLMGNIVYHDSFTASSQGKIILNLHDLAIPGVSTEKYSYRITFEQVITQQIASKSGWIYTNY